MLKKVLLVSAGFFLSPLSHVALASDKGIFDDFMREQPVVTHNYNIKQFKEDVQAHIQTHNIQQLSQELRSFSTELEQKRSTFSDLGSAPASPFQSSRLSLSNSIKSTKASYDAILHIDKQLTRPAQLNTWYNSASATLVTLREFIQATHETLILYKIDFTQSFILEKQKIYKTHLLKLFSIDDFLTTNKEIIHKIQNERQTFCTLIIKAQVDGEKNHTQDDMATPIAPNSHPHLATDASKLHEYVKTLIKEYEEEYKKLPTMNE